MTQRYGDYEMPEVGRQPDAAPPAEHDRRHRALELALQHHQGAGSDADAVVATARVFDDYLAGDTEKNRASSDS